MQIEVVHGEDWINGTTIWRVEYEYADVNGGGEAVDYFMTPNRYTPPSGLEIRTALDGEEMTTTGIEKIESYYTLTPADGNRLEYLPENSKHRRVYDSFRDEPPEYPLTTDPWPDQDE